MKTSKERLRYIVNWIKENPDRVRGYQRRWRKNNSGYKQEYQTEWYQKNKRRINQLHIQYNIKRRKTDTKFRLDHNIGIAICKSLKGKKIGRKWETLVGYTIKDLIQHLENLFDKNMSWDNYGGYWWIDHIKPRSLFCYTYPEDPQFKECWALKNLQPMEKIENIKKGKNY